MSNPGGINPNAPDVKFPFSVALPAARGLYQMGKNLDTIQSQRAKSYELTTGFWTGPHYDTFFQNSITIALHADGTRIQLQSLAGQVAEKWAKARGDQDRLNWARWVVAQQASGNQREDLDDYPPRDRADPVGPDYAETKQLHSDFGFFTSSGP